MSVIGLHKMDVAQRGLEVRFRGKSGSWISGPSGPLRTRNGNFVLESGHRVDVCRLDKGLLVRDARCDVLALRRTSFSSSQISEIVSTRSRKVIAPYRRCALS